MIYTIVKVVLGILFRLLYRFNIQSREKIPPSGPAIVAANHTSYADPIIVALVSQRPVSFMAKEELFGIPLFNWLIRSLHAFPVRRGKSDRVAIQRALKVLADDEVIGIFPEGTRQRSGIGLGPVEEGMALLAIKSNAPIVSLAIVGSDKIIPEGKILPRFPKIEARVGRVIHPDEFSPPEKEKRKKITEIWSEELIQLLSSEKAKADDEEIED